MYLAGTTTKVTCYKDNAGSASWSNPIVLDSGGNLSFGGVIWIPTGVTIKAVYAPSNDTDPPASPYRTIDNIAGINDTNALVSEWVSGSTPTFVSATQLNVSGDLTNTLTPNRRLKTTNTAGTIYSTITQRSFASGSTTVNVVSDSGSSLDSGLSALSYSIADPNNPSVPPGEIYRKGANVSSATNGTTDIWGVVGDYVHITGTTAVNHFSTAPYAGAQRTVITDGALPINHNASFISIPGLANVTSAANDRFVVRADTVSTATIVNYTNVPGIPATKGQQQTGTTAAVVVTPSQQHQHPSAVKAWVNFAPNTAASTCTIQQQYNVSTVTYLQLGTYRVGFTSPMTSGTYVPFGTVQHSSNNFPYLSGATSGAFGASSCVLNVANGANSAVEGTNVAVAFLGTQ